MFATVALLLLFANPAQEGVPTDPLFEKPLVATDGATFALNTIEATRQSELDAATAAKALSNPSLRDAAMRIGRQSELTRVKLESLARKKGWRIPAANPDRDTALPSAGKQRTDANYILQQISFHETMVAQLRAQVEGEGDADLKRVLRDSLPGYQKNLDLLLQLKL